MMENYGLKYMPVQETKYRKCGCYIKNKDLLDKVENQDILAPLKTSDYYLEIVNSVINVTLTQSYQNPTEQFLQMEYSFPVAPQACIYRFTAEFGKTRIEGVIKEKQEAKREYKEAIEEGRMAAYGELNSESKDIMNLKVGNVPPKEIVKIEISYLQELSLSCNTFYQLHMMGTISPRYMKYIPVEHIRGGFRNKEAKCRGEFYWNFRISLKTTRKVTFYDSHTHKLDTISENDARTSVELAMTKASVPNKDFIFTFTTEDFQIPSYVLGRTDVGSSAMLSFIPKFCDLNIDDAYKASVVGNGYETNIDHAKGEYIFLLDRSGSMKNGRINKAKQALILFIKSLPEQSAFNVISFGSKCEQIFPSSYRVIDQTVTDAIIKIRTMGATLGGTKIAEPLGRLLAQPLIEGYPRQIFLLTDGCVLNTEEILTMVVRNNKYSRVHTIGIGNGCSKQLIEGCAEKGRGHYVFIDDQENPSEKIIQLLTNSLSPVISKIQLDYDRNIVESIIPNPELMPYILKNQLVNFYVTFRGQLEQPAVFSFTYEDNFNKLPYKSQMVIDPDMESESFIDRMGHFKKIRLLEDSYHNNTQLEEMMFLAKSVKIVDKKVEIIKESVRHQVLSQFTAFICVEKELVDGKFSQIKDKGQMKVTINNPLPVVCQKIQYSLAEMSYCAPMEPIREIKDQRKRKSRMNKQTIKLDIEAQINMEFKKIAPTKKREIMKSSLAYCLPTQGVSTNSKKKLSTNAFTSKSKISSRDIVGRPSTAGGRGEQRQQKQKKKQVFKRDKSQKQVFKKDKSQTNFRNQEIQQSWMGDCMRDDCELDQMMKGRSFCREKIRVKEKEQFIPIFKKRQMAQEQLAVQRQQTSLASQFITEIVSCQSTEGCWKDIELITKLYSQELQEKVARLEDKVLIITYLVAKWIEKHCPQKQYSLLVKKGLNYVSKRYEHFEKIVKEYLPYLQ